MMFPGYAMVIMILCLAHCAIAANLPIAIPVDADENPDLPSPAAENLDQPPAQTRGSHGSWPIQKIVLVGTGILAAAGFAGVACKYAQDIKKRIKTNNCTNLRKALDLTPENTCEDDQTGDIRTLYDPNGDVVCPNQNEINCYHLDTPGDQPGGSKCVPYEVPSTPLSTYGVVGAKFKSCQQAIRDDMERAEKRAVIPGMHQ